MEEERDIFYIPPKEEQPEKKEEVKEKMEEEIPQENKVEEKVEVQTEEKMIEETNEIKENKPEEKNEIQNESTNEMKEEPKENQTENKEEEKKMIEESEIGCESFEDLTLENFIIRVDKSIDEEIVQWEENEERNTLKRMKLADEKDRPSKRGIQKTNNQHKAKTQSKEKYAITWMPR